MPNWASILPSKNNGSPTTFGFLYSVYILLRNSFF